MYKYEISSSSREECEGEEKEGEREGEQGERKKERETQEHNCIGTYQLLIFAIGLDASLAA